MGRSLNLSPLVVIASLMVWGTIWGVVGMFLCVPIMVMVKNQGKSSFLKEFFVDHPKAKGGEINEAWRAAGNQGQISSST